MPRRAKDPTKKRKRKTQTEEIDATSLAALVNKEFGPDTIRMASDPYFHIQRVPTGILSLDVLLGGGFPRGRHVEIYGQYATMKTYTCLRTIASAQSLGLQCVYLDAEHTFDPNFAARAGVDLESLVLHEQESGNQLFNLMETLLRSQQYGVIALDSIAALLPKQEREQDMEAGTYGTHQAKLMSAALRRLTAANKSTVLIYINQLRDAIGVMFGKRSVTSGGRAMSFYASSRLEMSRTETIKRKASVIDPKTGDPVKKDVVKGHRVLIRLEKDKVSGRAQQTTSCVFDYDQAGVDYIEDLIFLGRERDLVGKRGDTWWVEGFEDEEQTSRERFRAWLKKNVAVQEDLRDRILNPNPTEEIEDDDDD